MTLKRFVLNSSYSKFKPHLEEYKGFVQVIP